MGLKMQLSILTILLLVCLGLGLVQGAQVQEKKRDPKLFYVSTTTTTSTWYGSTICFASTTTSLGTCGRRKRRAVSISDLDPEYAAKINPSSISDDESALVEPSEENDSRKGRFLVYWMTTTSVSTSSSYTTTLTVASLTCTPSSFAFSLCG